MRKIYSGTENIPLSCLKERSFIRVLFLFSLSKLPKSVFLGFGEEEKKGSAEP